MDGTSGVEGAPDRQGTRPGAQVRVTRGGVPSDAELAALTVAVTALRRAATSGPAAVPPAWTRAALLEGVGLAAISRPSELVRQG